MKIVAYHANCVDGFTAAWVAWRRFGDASFVPVNYGGALPDAVARAGSEDEVFFVDFCPTGEELRGLCDRVRRLVVLDHHASRERVMVNLLPDDESVTPFGFAPGWEWSGTLHRGNLHRCDVYLRFGANESGAELAWEAFFFEERVPRLVRYVGDRDLWKWELGGSREVSAFIRNWEFEFPVWEKLCDRLNREFERCVETGSSLLRRDELLVERLVERPVWVPFGEFYFPAVAAGVLQSEACEALLGKFPDARLAGVWREGYSERGEWLRFWSLRSRSPEECDVSVLAARWGGGGHPCAAGFRERALRAPDGLLCMAWKDEPEAKDGWAHAEGDL